MFVKNSRFYIFRIEKTPFHITDFPKFLCLGTFDLINKIVASNYNP